MPTIQTCTNDADLKKISKLDELAGKSRLYFHGHDIEHESYLEDHRIYMYKDHGQIKGFVACGLNRVNDKFRAISAVVVDPEFRGQSIAKELLKTCLEQEQDNFYLTVHPENLPALIVYLKTGFIIKEYVENKYGDGEPRLVMYTTKFKQK